MCLAVFFATDTAPNPGCNGDPGAPIGRSRISGWCRAFFDSCACHCPACRCPAMAEAVGEPASHSFVQPSSEPAPPSRCPPFRAAPSRYQQPSSEPAAPSSRPRTPFRPAELRLVSMKEQRRSVARRLAVTGVKDTTATRQADKESSPVVGLSDPLTRPE